MKNKHTPKQTNKRSDNNFQEKTINYQQTTIEDQIQEN